MRLAPFVVVLVGLAGCGGGSERADTDATPPSPQIRGPSPLVPTEAVGPPPPGAEGVIRSWAAAVRRADWGRAADLVASGAHVQTGGQPERLRSRNQVLAWNASRACAMHVVDLGGARGYAIARLRLTRRPGSGTCGNGGTVIRVAIKVEDGHIVRLYVIR